jgi:drug/metabolite transporter (DMT)-like permease
MDLPVLFLSGRFISFWPFYFFLAVLFSFWPFYFPSKTGSFLNITYGEFIGLLGAFIWALHSLLLRTQVHKASPLLLNAFRCAVASIFFWILLPFGAPKSAYTSVTGLEWLMLAGSVLLIIGVGDTLHMISMREIGISRSMGLTGIHPLTTLFFERIILGTPFNETFIAGCVLVVVGITLLSSRVEQTAKEDTDSGRLTYGILLALAAAVCWGLGTVITKPAIAHLTPVQANSIRMPLVALCLYLSYRWSGQQRQQGQRLKQLGGRTLLIMGAVGILGMGLGSLSFLVALELIGPAKTTLLAGLSPVMALIMAVIFLKEQVNIRIVLGVILSTTGVWLVL